MRHADIAGRLRGAGIVLVALAALGLLSREAVAAEKHTSPLTTIVNTHLYADPGPVPEWVEKSRPAGGSDYIPLHVPPAERQAKPKSPAELKAMEADLDAAAAANRRRAGGQVGVAPKKSGKVSSVQSGAAAPIH
ncbi:MAG: hypothetical protein JO004_12200 [Methylobacteriaceae bacterium]|nr:hypothetical protein [Methylobacteriaceae bacterium]